MSRYRRSDIVGGTFFFTVNTFRRQPLLTRPDIRNALRESIADVRHHMPFTIVAWVLLPDHLHCVWELPPEDAAFGMRWGRIKRYVSRSCVDAGEILPSRSSSRAKRRETTVWQRRFWEHQIRDDGDFRRHIDYIHWNPVKHGHVRRVADWPYSTFHRFVREGVYPADWGGESIVKTADRDFGE